MRYFAEIAYDGTDYFGWQVQPNKKTIQGEINRAISTITQEKVNVVGCGRTDSGVHASQYFLHFDLANKLPENITYKLNSILSSAIVFYRVFQVNEDQHSRFHAVKRSYVYHMHFKKNPFRERFSSYCYYNELDFQLMKRVAIQLKQYNDFAPVSKRSDDVKTTLCNIFHSDLLYYKEQNRIELRISANRFLHNMIRRVMGLLVSVGRGKISIQEVDEVFVKGGEFSLNFVAPPQGLFLCGVDYPFVDDRE